MTSASGAIFAKAEVVGGAGVSEVTTMLAVDVGERCNAKGCMWSACVVLKAGLGRARICDRRFSSKKVACSSITINKLGQQLRPTSFQEAGNHTFPVLWS